MIGLDPEFVDQLVEVGREATSHLRAPHPECDEERATARACSDRLMELIDDLVETRNEQQARGSS